MALDQITSQSIASGAITVEDISNGSITAAKLHDTAIADKLGYTPVSPTQLNNLIDSAPTALDTLNELAAALGDDANFASTVTTALAAKASITYVDDEIAAIEVTPTQVSDKNNTSTGYFDLPSGTTAQRPSSPAFGMMRANTTTGYVEYYDTTSSSWLGIGAFAANGGSVSQSGSYTYHTFTSSGTFTVTSGARSVDYLVVAGGGSGGGHNAGYYEGGGGGAGGYISGTVTMTPGNYSVVIGAGGAAASGTSNLSGSNTTALNFTAIGGGRGGAGATTGANGGSGGGSGWINNTERDNFTGWGSGTVGQGNRGGAAGGPNNGGGGGGGAGGAGGHGSTQNGFGGPGTTWVNGSAYAGGGGGGRYSSGNGGGVGGGGAGQSAGSAGVGTAGSSNTGGGGGGGWNSGQSAGSNGGSGIVIVRYLS